MARGRADVMGLGAVGNGGCGPDEWALHSVELLLGPSPELGALFAALLCAVDEAQLFPHTIHCDHERDGYRLHASCDAGPAPMTMDGIVRILRRREVEAVA
jgi:hypothetical protein